MSSSLGLQWDTILIWSDQNLAQVFSSMILQYTHNNRIMYKPIHTIHQIGKLRQMSRDVTIKGSDGWVHGHLIPFIYDLQSCQIRRRYFYMQLDLNTNTILKINT